MSKERFPITQAIRALKKYGVDFTLHTYRFEDKGVTSAAAKGLCVDEHTVIKTLVMEDENGNPLLALMHGDRKVSTKALARVLGVKRVRACDPKVAHKHTGYVVGGISPLGTKRPLKVFVEESVMNLPRVYINAGKRGLLAEVAPGDLIKTLKPTLVNIAV